MKFKLLVLAYLVVPGVSKVLLQTSQLALETFVLLSKGEPLLWKVITIKRHQKREQQGVKKKITTHIDRVGHIVVVISEVSASAHISVVQVLLVLRVVVALLKVDL